MNIICGKEDVGEDIDDVLVRFSSKKNTKGRPTTLLCDSKFVANFKKKKDSSYAVR